MPHAIPAGQYAKRRQKLLADSNLKLIVIAANLPLQKSRDEAFDFQQDTNFLYLTGINEPGWVLVIEAAGSWLIAPPRQSHEDYFGGQLNLETLRQTSGIKQIEDTATGWRRLKQVLASQTAVGVQQSLPAYHRFYNMHLQPTRRRLNQKLKRLSPKTKQQDVARRLSLMRMAKDSYEIAAIQSVVDITADALASVKQQLKTFTSEYQIELAISQVFRAQQARHGYDPIVAAGEHAATIHYQANDGAYSPKNGLLIDVGAKRDYYSADISRTYHLEPDQFFLDTHQAVKQLQDYAMTLLKPGVNIRDYEMDMESKMGEQLRNLGLITGSKRRDIRHYFHHATSHMLGLDLHDATDFDQPIPNNSVITVEPGIYVPEKQFGIRIEDNVLITKDGNVNLSAQISRELS